VKSIDDPDISDILKRKAEGRAASAKLNFVEKARRMEELRERLGPVARRRAAKSSLDTPKTSS
jgi:hypothetical protein